MHPALRHGVVAVALMTLVPAARAEMAIYYRSGSWDAFSGTDTENKATCGIGSTNPTDNRSFAIRYRVAADGAVFQVKKPNWNIPAGTQLPVIVQMGPEAPWNFQGVGNGQSVEWTLDRAAMPAFDAQFRRGSSMTVSYPSGNEATWTVGLNGSTAISNAFGRCVTEMRQRAEGQAAVPSGPTQPFGQEPTQPVTPPR